MKTHHDSRLFIFTSKFLKYFLLTLIGFAITYVMSMSFGALHLVIMLLPIVGHWFWRLGLILLCLLATTVVVESLR